eukprot:TRINITY_DN916_c0_g1_i3.p1 TRINITY_DN916_c0_g1~~TRINITY_DN916_c0_g1_i3.p1  ORF type:complete len:242 (+),score=58.69 TRINITY_DN916_c0_g1_i3:288-1013(+)
MLSDSIALVIGFVSLRLSKKSSNNRFSYGWMRSEIIGGLFNGVFLLSACLFIVMESVHKFLDIEENHVENPLMVVYVGIGGLVINLLGLIIFAGSGQHGHSHADGGGHGHSHKEDIYDNNHNHGKYHNQEEHSSIFEDEESLNIKTVKYKNENITGVILHLAGDFLGSIAAIASGLGIHFISDEEDWKFYLDPVVSVVIVLIILASAIPLVIRCINILMQSVPGHVDLAELRREISEVFQI